LKGVVHLPPIFNAQNISQSYDATPLFRSIVFTIEEGDRIGVIGPNGSGKSTLLQILSGTIEPDSGELAVRKHVRLGLVQQESHFAAGQTVRSGIESWRVHEGPGLSGARSSCPRHLR